MGKELQSISAKGAHNVGTYVMFSPGPGQPHASRGIVVGLRVRRTTPYPPAPMQFPAVGKDAQQQYRRNTLITYEVLTDSGEIVLLDGMLKRRCYAADVTCVGCYGKRVSPHVEHKFLMGFCDNCKSVVGLYWKLS